MNDQTTVKSMNLSVQKPNVMMNFKVSAAFKTEIEEVAKICNMTVSALIRIAIEEKITKIKE